jgi:hypothetical protein
LPRLDAAQGHESLTVRQWNLNARDAEQYKQKQKERVGGRTYIKHNAFNLQNLQAHSTYQQRSVVEEDAFGRRRHAKLEQAKP